MQGGEGWVGPLGWGWMGCDGQPAQLLSPTGREPPGLHPGMEALRIVPTPTAKHCAKSRRWTSKQSSPCRHLLALLTA